jgi:ABC-type branched-subunit amino acid transport system substrate-binding protein
MAFTQLDGLRSVIPTNLLFPGTAALVPSSLSPGPIKNAVSDYYDALRARNIQPDQGTLAPWAPALVVVAALQKYGPNTSAEQIRSFAAAFKGPSVMGTFDFPRFPQRGLDASTVLMVRWDKNARNVVAVSTFGGAPRR